MKEQFVSYEQAKALKELGFDEPCFGYFSNLDNSLRQGHYGSPPNETIISTPLKQQAFQWFLKQHDLDYTIIPDPSSQHKELLRQYSVSIFRYANGINVQAEILRDNEGMIVTFNKRENAESVCIDKLIEIVKNKKS